MAEQVHPQRALVDLMIVGAHKAGTTTLLEYVAQHRGVERQVTPEMTWFTNPGLDAIDVPALARRYFPRSSGAPKRVGKLAGLMYEEGAVTRLRQFAPDAHVVAVLRDPVRRAYSAFLHARVRGREPLGDFADAIDGDPTRFIDEASRRSCAYVERGQYAEPVSRLIATFEGRAHIVFFEELVQDPKATVAPIMGALGLDLHALPGALPIANRARTARIPIGSLKESKTARRAAQFLAPRARDRMRGALRRMSETPGVMPPLDAETEALLRERFAPNNARLAELLSRPLPSGW